MSPTPVAHGARFATRLWLVRHAAPLVAPGTCYGSMDVAADAAATHAAATRLAAALPLSPRVLYSPLQRCEQLALALQALRPDSTPIPDARLREMDFGAWEGQRWNDIAKSDIDAWTAAFATHAPGGGESLNAMLARVSAALRVARQGAGSNAVDRQDDAPSYRIEQGTRGSRGSKDPIGQSGAVNEVVWITHAGVARCVHWLQQHGDTVLPRADAWPQAAPGFGEWEVRTLA